jgi:hypothetical protein
MLGDEVKTALKLWFHHHYAQLYCDDLQNYLHVDQCVSSAKMVMGGNNCTEVNNEVKESYPF